MYVTSDLQQLASMGTAIGYVALLVFALYLINENSKELYAFPAALWLILPLMLYWMSRVWILAQRGHMHEDPVVFTIRDKVRYGLGGLCVVIMWFATGW